MRRGSISAGYAPISRVTFLRRPHKTITVPQNAQKKLKFYQKSLKVCKKGKLESFQAESLFNYGILRILPFCFEIVSTENNAGTKWLQRFAFSAVKNSKCMASQSIEIFWWFGNIVFRVLFFNQLCSSKKAKTFDWHTSVLSQLEFSICNLFGQNSNPLPPSFPNGQMLNVSETLSNREHGMRYLHHRWHSTENSSVNFM